MGEEMAPYVESWDFVAYSSINNKKNTYIETSKEDRQTFNNFILDQLVYLYILYMVRAISPAPTYHALMIN